MEIEQLKNFLGIKINELENKKRNLEIEYNWTIANKTTHQAQISEIDYKSKKIDFKKNFIEITSFILGIIFVLVSLPIMYNITEMSILLVNIIGGFEIVVVSFLPEIISEKMINNNIKKQLVAERKIHLKEIKSLKQKEETIEEKINKLTNDIDYIDNYLVSIKEYLKNNVLDDYKVEQVDELKTDLVFSTSSLKRIKK